MKILAFRYTNHDLRSNKDYATSFRFESADGGTTYFDYHSKHLIPQNNQITTSDNRLISSKPIKLALFKIGIVFSHETEVIAYYDFSKHVFYNKHHEPLVYIIDPTPRLKTHARNALGSDPDTYKICDSTKNIVYGEIKSIKQKAKLFWPLSIVEKIIKVLIAGDKKPLYEINLSSLPIDKELILVALAVLDTNLLSNQSAT